MFKTFWKPVLTIFVCINVYILKMDKNENVKILASSFMYFCNNSSKICLNCRLKWLYIFRMDKNWNKNVILISSNFDHFEGNIELWNFQFRKIFKVEFTLQVIINLVFVL